MNTLSSLPRPYLAAAGLFQKADYARIWRARELHGNLPDQDRRASFAAALKARIDTVGSERAAVIQARQRQPYEYRLRQLAGALAAVGGQNSLQTVLEILSVPNEWDNHSAVNPVETLLFNGVPVPAARAIPLFEAILTQLRKHGWQQPAHRL